MFNTTLQINLSPGDTDYAELTVPALLAAHPNVDERLLVVDVCKPQRTGIVDPAARFPEPTYTRRVERILHIAEKLQQAGKVDRVVVLHPGNEHFPLIARKYLRPWVTETHDYGGCALMAYLVAFEECRTKYLLHYDADMLLHQDSGYDWLFPGIEAMARYDQVVATSPRQAPPDPSTPELPTSTEVLALERCGDGWLNTWFSTRCYLLDLEKLRPLLPLMQGRLYWESIAARLLGRGYPRSPEIMLFRRLGAAKRRRLTLHDQRAWMLHPVRKDRQFIEALPHLLRAVSRGECAAGQRGVVDLHLDLPGWEPLLHAD